MPRRCGIIRALLDIQQRISANRATGDETTVDLRIGLGEDTHRTAPVGPLRLGGIDLPHDRQLVGHSDADVLLHAITDALLGAAGLPDIGEMFPNTDEANRDRDSGEMLQAVAKLVASAGYQIVNLDCVVAAQRPRIGPHKESIKQRIAQLLAIHPNQVNLKGKTGEGVGPVGREETMEARCVVLLAVSSQPPAISQESTSPKS